MLKDDLRHELASRFGDRVTFDRADLLPFARDASVPPPPIKFLFRAMPDALVAPRDEADLAWLGRWATEHRVPLVPRGGGSTWLGGAVPTWGGVVVDMRALPETFLLDEVAGTVTVSAGMNVGDVGRRLARRGFALAVEPLNAPSRTVGGWLATGGAPFGSLRHGDLARNVAAVELVLPLGDVREFRGDELDVVLEANGITGFLTRATLRVRPAETLVPVLATFADLDALGRALAALPARFPLAAAQFRTPAWHALKTELRGRKGLPDTAFSLLLALAKKDHEAHGAALGAALKDLGGTPLDDKRAAEEWAARSWPLEAKVLGPSAIATEFVVPAARAVDALRDLHERVPSPWFAVEGSLVDGGRAHVLTFALDDERRPPYPLAFGPQLHALAVAKRLGGHAVGTGIFQASHHKLSLDTARRARLANFKNAVDPKVVMNPGKVFFTPMRFVPKGLARMGMKQGQPLPTVQQAMAQGGPLLKLLPKMPGGSLAAYRRAHQPRSWGAASDRIWFRSMGGASCEPFGYQALAQVGVESMDSVCPTWKALPVGGHGPSERVKWLRDILLGNLAPTPAMVDRAHWCTSCGACSAVTGNRTDGRGIMEGLKAGFREMGLGAPEPIEKVAANALAGNNHYGADAKARDGLLGAAAKKKGAVLLWLDCATAYRLPRVAKNLAELFALAKVDVAYLGSEERCAGGLLFRAGFASRLDDLVAANVKAIAASGATTLVTPSADAYLAFTRDYPVVAQRLGLPWTVKVQHASQFLAQLVKEKKLPLGKAELAFAFHDACMLGPASLVTEEPRALLAATGATVKDLGSGPGSPGCGAGAGFEFAFNAASNRVAASLFAAVRPLGTKTVVSSCTQCETHLAAASAALHAGVEVLDVSDVVLAAAKRAAATPAAPAPVAG